MEFARRAGAAAILIALTLWLQAGGMTVLIHFARAYAARGKKGLSEWRAAVLMVRFTTFMIALHITQIWFWAAFYRWKCFPSWESSFYFSAGSYSTVGYGDIVLPHVWRTLGPIESIIGVLMCGMSVSTLLAIGSRLVESEEASSATAGT
jgi:voltage-gated potassium channel